MSAEYDARPAVSKNGAGREQSHERSRARRERPHPQRNQRDDQSVLPDLAGNDDPEWRGDLGDTRDSVEPQRSPGDPQHHTDDEHEHPID